MTHEKPLHPDLVTAYGIVNKLHPNKRPEFNCMLVAAAIAGLRGHRFTQIRIGAYFHRVKFANDMRGGWGCAGVDHATGKVFIDDSGMDDEGGFNGHTWIAIDSDTVLDLMHEVDGGPVQELDPKWNTIGAYHRLPRLEKQVKQFWKAEMMDCLKAGKKQRGARA